MSLIVDERRALGGVPAVHALIIGVSDYPHLPGHGLAPHQRLAMRPLSASALTGNRIIEWLRRRKHRLPLPLATVRLLTSPIPEETPSLSPAARSAPRATLEHFLREVRAWRQDASTHPENLTFFYFAGHGLQRRKNDSIILLQDFGDGLGGWLRHGIDINQLINGMAPSASCPHIARRQLYFVDACRNVPVGLDKYEVGASSEPFGDTELGGRDDRHTAAFYAALPGSKAYALRGEQTVFCKALLHCLDVGGEAKNDANGHVVWTVTTQSLSRSLDEYFNKLPVAERSDQQFTPVLSGQDIAICRLEDPPVVKVRLEISPEAALAVTKLQVKNYREEVVHDLPLPLPQHPFFIALPAGTYGLTATIEPPTVPFTTVRDWRQVIPPPKELCWKVLVGA